MRLHLLCVGSRQPDWVKQGVETFTRRMPRECALIVTEIPALRRGKSDPPQRAISAECERLQRAVPEGALVVALDEKGEAWTTQRLAKELGRWREEHRDVALLIGGPDGLAPQCLQSARYRWSLSAHTLPHGLARIIVAEQLYRAYTILTGHPYHRE